MVNQILILYIAYSKQKENEKKVSQFNSTFSVTFSDYSLYSFTCYARCWVNTIKTVHLPSRCMMHSHQKRYSGNILWWGPGRGSGKGVLEEITAESKFERRVGIFQEKKGWGEGIQDRNYIWWSKGGEKECWLRGKYVIQGSLDFTFF